MKIIAKFPFEFNGNKYLKGEEVKVDNFKQVIKLNELGFIEPLSYEELVKIERLIKDKEERKWTEKI